MAGRKEVIDKVTQEFFTNVSPIKNIIRRNGELTLKKAQYFGYNIVIWKQNDAEFIIKNNPNKTFLGVLWFN